MMTNLSGVAKRTLAHVAPFLITLHRFVEVGDDDNENDDDEGFLLRTRDDADFRTEAAETLLGACGWWSP